ncbi:MAG: hypothetical protein V2J24_09795 [Pseudomonadales bacterium]|jgi:hypothetical protein|nr:hypothetical protein [Pseudomonadales bacterium]
MDRIPTWVIDDTSGAAGAEPSDWTSTEEEHGVFWRRVGLKPFGRANALFRNRFYRCPDCDSFLRPLRRRGFFACVGCLTAFQWRGGVLSGYGRKSDAAITVSPSEFNLR